MVKLIVSYRQTETMECDRNENMICQVWLHSSLVDSPRQGSVVSKGKQLRKIGDWSYPILKQIASLNGLSGFKHAFIHRAVSMNFYLLESKLLRILYYTFSVSATLMTSESQVYVITITFSAVTVASGQIARCVINTVSLPRDKCCDITRERLSTVCCLCR